LATERGAPDAGPAGDAKAGPAASHSAGTAVTIASPTLAFTSIDNLHDIFARFTRALRQPFSGADKRAREYGLVSRMSGFADFARLGI
jgi:hypothetical protein